MDTGIPTSTVRAVLFDQVGAFAEPGVVLRVVPARFGHVIIEVEEHLVAHNFFVVDFWALGDGFANQRDGVLALPVVFDIPGHVIDAGADVIDFFVRCAYPLREHLRCPLDTVTEPRDGNLGLVLHSTTEHRHGVCVVEHHR